MKRSSCGYVHVFRMAASSRVGSSQGDGRLTSIALLYIRCSANSRTCHSLVSVTKTIASLLPVGSEGSCTSSVFPLHADMHRKSDSSSTAGTKDVLWFHRRDMGLGYQVPTMLLFHDVFTPTDADGVVNRLPDRSVFVFDANRTSSMVTE